MKALMILTLVATFTFNAEARRDKGRERHQDARIAQGVGSGELTHREKRKLMKGQKKVDAYQKKAMADGSMSAKEKVKLEKMQDRQSKQIYKQKHDEQERGSGPVTNPGGPSTGEIK